MFSAPQATSGSLMQCPIRGWLAHGPLRSHIIKILPIVTRYRKDLQDSCRRMASALPPRCPNQGMHSEPACADPYAELAPRGPHQAVRNDAQSQLDSPFTSSVSKVIMPRNPSSSSRASSTTSIGSGKRSSRLRMGPNPFEAANSTDAIEEGNEEEEVGPALPQSNCSLTILTTLTWQHV